VFGDGSQVIVNYGITSFDANGTRIPPKGFCLNTHGEVQKAGAMNRDIIYI
jgi:hypothetical protein